MIEPYKSRVYEEANLLSSEAAAGISFSNILIGIGTATTGLIIATPPAGEYAFSLSCSLIILVSSIYSTVTYSNVHGILRDKLDDFSSAAKAILVGNVLSEYFGIYIVNAVLVSLVFSYSQEIIYTRITYCVVLISFVIYNATNYSLISRVVKSIVWRVSTSLIIGLVGVAAIESVQIGSHFLAYGLGALYVGICGLLGAYDLRSHYQNAENTRLGMPRRGRG